jgi:hypothetical protein
MYSRFFQLNVMVMGVEKCKFFDFVQKSAGLFAKDLL